jgi:hypothetical protein
MGKLTKEQIQQARIEWGHLTHLPPGLSWQNIATQLFETVAPFLQYQPEPVSGELIEKMRDACGGEDGHWPSKSAMIAAASVLLDEALGPMSPEESNSLFHKQRRIVDDEWRIVAIVNYFRLARCARLLAPKTPEERVIVRLKPGCGVAVYLDEQQDGPDFLIGEAAEIYADGLRYRLEKEKGTK